MGVNIQEFVSNTVLGNIRIGARNENDRPVKLDHFDVHIDRTTSSLAVEIFKEKYNNPKKLKIKFIKDNPIDIYYERYEGRKRVCIGNNKQAISIDSKGKKTQINCDCNTCEYAQNRKCKSVGRLYFVVDKLEDEGYWCFPLGNSKAVTNIARKLERAKRLGENITENWYELFLIPEDTAFGKVYVPDIIKVSGNTSNVKDEQKSDEKQKTSGSTSNEDLLMIKSLQTGKIENKEVTKIICIDRSSKEQELFLMPDGNKEILNLSPKSVILPLSISENNGMAILKDYKIVKAISAKENKKAV